MLEKDAYRAANLLIKKHGDKAANVADGKMQVFMKAGDMKAAGAWLRVCEAIEQLLSGSDGKVKH